MTQRTGTPIPDFGSGMSSDKSVLPFGRKNTDEKAVAVVIKVLSNDSEVRRRAVATIQDALRGARVDGLKLPAVVTDEDVSIGLADMEQLAAHLLPLVLSRMGVRGTAVAR